MPDAKQPFSDVQLMQIIRELATRKPIMISQGGSANPIWEPIGNGSSLTPPVAAPSQHASNSDPMDEPAHSGSGSLSLLEIGRRAAMAAERAAIERTLQETRWNRRQAAKILKVSYKALLNKMKVMDEHDLLKKKSSATK